MNNAFLSVSFTSVFLIHFTRGKQSDQVSTGGLMRHLLVQQHRHSTIYSVVDHRLLVVSQADVGCHRIGLPDSSGQPVDRVGSPRNINFTRSHRCRSKLRVSDVLRFNEHEN